jgi:hypothetical protein
MGEDLQEFWQSRNWKKGSAQKEHRCYEEEGWVVKMLYLRHDSSKTS